jgi:hypothetical protein
LRERGSVLVPVVPGHTAAPRRPGAWPADVTLSVRVAAWEGLGEGHGHLRRRRVEVAAEGRGRAARPRRAELWLPSAIGPVAAVAPSSAGPGAVGATTPAPAQGGGGATVVPFRPGRRAG